MTTIKRERLPLYHRLRGRDRSKVCFNFFWTPRKIRLVWCSSLLWVSISTLMLLSFVVFDGSNHLPPTDEAEPLRRRRPKLGPPVKTFDPSHAYESTRTPYRYPWKTAPTSLFNKLYRIALEKEYEWDIFTEHHITLPTVEERVRYYMGEYWYGFEDEYEYYDSFTNLNLHENTELDKTLQQKKKSSWCRRNAPPMLSVNASSIDAISATKTASENSTAWKVWYYLWCGEQTEPPPRSEVDEDLIRAIPYMDVTDPYAMQNWRLQFHHNPEPEFVREGLFDTPFLFDQINLHQLLAQAEFGVQGYPKSKSHQKIKEETELFELNKPILHDLVGGPGFTAYVREAFLMMRVMNERHYRVKFGSFQEANAMLMYFGKETDTFMELRLPVLSQSRKMWYAPFPGILAPFDQERRIGDREMGLNDGVLEFKDTSNTTISSVLNRVFGRMRVVQLEHENPNRTVWEDKRSTVVWRGQIAGKRQKVIDMYRNHSKDDIDLEFGLFNTTDLLPYKYLLSLEGNGVSSDLKWMLYAPDSVVFMPEPNHTSWIMEDKLLAWYHYIPLFSNASDIPEKLQWAREHDEVCRRIARQSTQYIYDLILSDKAQEDEAKILQQMAERYHGKYGHLLADYIDKNPSSLRIPAHTINPLNYTFEFPSVEERVRYYMGLWYYFDIQNPPHVNMSLMAETLRFSIYDLERVEDWKDKYHAEQNLHRRFDEEGYSFPLVDVPLVFDKTCLEQFVALSEEKQGEFGIFSNYANDAYDRVFKFGPPGMKVLMSFGDMNRYSSVPVMVKSRKQHVDTSIISPFNVYRHYIKTITKVDNILQKVKWEDKRSTVIWRGATTGRRYNIVKTLSTFSKQDIDVGFVDLVGVNKTGEVLRMKGREISVREMLAYRYFLCLEGNDVATGLKWMLYAPDAVVFMHRPTQISWAMEDKLVPFVHYIPLQQEDASDLPYMLRWARENEEKCKAISRHATKYIEDLFASEQAQKNNEIIMRKITRRYYETFQLLLEETTDVAGRALPSSSSSSVFTTPYENFKKDLKLFYSPTRQNDTEADPISFVWMLSFPLSGAANILRGIANVSGYATASNYATNKSIDILDSGFGPFITDETLHMERPKYILTSTHCGDGGDNAFPFAATDSDSMTDIVQFIKYCTSHPTYPAKQTVSAFPVEDFGYAPWENHETNVAMTSYPVKHVKKAIHLIRHPLDNIIAHFILNNYMTNDTIVDPYAFQWYCFHKRNKAEQSLNRWNATVRDVPCISEIIKWVNWHNRAFAISRFMRLPTLVVRYEDYAESHYGSDLFGMEESLITQNQILEFIEQPLRHPDRAPRYYKDLANYNQSFPEDQRTQMPAFIETLNTMDHWYEFEEAEQYRTLLYQQNSFFFFFSPEQRLAIREFIKSIASLDLWNYIKEYDFDLG